MISRRSILRALGLGAPAAAVAAVVGLPKMADGGVVRVPRPYRLGEVGPEYLMPKVDASRLSAISGNIGELRWCRIQSGDGSITFEHDQLFFGAERKASKPSRDPDDLVPA